MVWLIKDLVRKRGLEPLWIAPPDPKSGASANFATFALITYRQSFYQQKLTDPI